MKRPLKFHTRSDTFDPANTRLESFQRVELHPDNFLKTRTLNKLDFAAMWGEIVNVDTILVLGCAAEIHFGAQANPVAFAR